MQYRLQPQTIYANVYRWHTTVLSDKKKIEVAVSFAKEASKLTVELNEDKHLQL